MVSCGPRVVAKRLLRAGFRPVPLMAVGSFGLASEPLLPAVFHVSVDPLAWPRATVPRASPPRGPAVRTPLHSVSVLIARPMFRGTRLYGAVFLVHPIVSGLLLTADLHGGPVLTGPLLTRPCFSGNARRSAADRVPPPCCLWYLSTPLHRVATMAPGVLETCAASPFISRSCSPVLCPGQEVSNKEVSRRAVARTGRWGVWAPTVLASLCPCEVM